MHTNAVVKLKVQDAGCCIPRVAAEEVFAWPKLRGRLPKVAVLYLQTLQTPAKNRARQAPFLAYSTSILLHRLGELLCMLHDVARMQGIRNVSEHHIGSPAMPNYPPLSA